MPLAVSVRDTSQVTPLEPREIRPEGDSEVRQVEAISTEPQADAEGNARVEVVRRIGAEDSSELALRTEFENQRLEAETRLALSVERVEIEQDRPASRNFLQDKVPVVIFGSLRLDVEA